MARPKREKDTPEAGDAWGEAVFERPRIDFSAKNPRVERKAVGAYVVYDAANGRAVTRVLRSIGRRNKKETFILASAEDNGNGKMRMPVFGDFSARNIQDLKRVGATLEVEGFSNATHMKKNTGRRDHIRRKRTENAEMIEAIEMTGVPTGRNPVALVGSQRIGRGMSTEIRVSFSSAGNGGLIGEMPPMPAPVPVTLGDVLPSSVKQRLIPGSGQGFGG